MSDYTGQAIIKGSDNKQKWDKSNLIPRRWASEIPKVFNEYDYDLFRGEWVPNGNTITLEPKLVYTKNNPADAKTLAPWTDQIIELTEEQVNMYFRGQPIPEEYRGQTTFEVDSIWIGSSEEYRALVRDNIVTWGTAALVGIALLNLIWGWGLVITLVSAATIAFFNDLDLLNYNVYYIKGELKKREQETEPTPTMTTVETREEVQPIPGPVRIPRIKWIKNVSGDYTKARIQVENYKKLESRYEEATPGETYYEQRYLRPEGEIIFKFNRTEIKAEVLQEDRSSSSRITTVYVRLPPPPAGLTEARVIVKNIGSTEKANDHQEKYFDYITRCEPPSAPPIEPPPSISPSDIEDANTECFDSVADLFCSESILAPIDEGEKPVQKTKEDFKTTLANFILEKGETVPGRLITVFFDLTGAGSYTLTCPELNKQIASNISFNAGSGKQVLQYLHVPSNISEDISQLQLVLNVRPSDGSPNLGGLQSITVKRPPIQPVIPREIKSDNDFGDAKKEIYYMHDFVPGIITENDRFVVEKNIIDYINFDHTRWTQQSYGENILLPKDLFRQNNGSFHIMNEQETKLIFAKNKNQFPIISMVPNSMISTPHIIPLEKENGQGFGYIQESFRYVRNDATPNMRDIVWDVFRDAYFPKDKSNSVIDFSYSYLKPYTEKELKLVGEKALSSAVIKQHSEYNFYNKKYEEIHYDINEILLPNMYFLAFNREAVDGQKTKTTDDDLGIDPDIRAAITLDENFLNAKTPIDIKRYYDFYVKQNRTKEIKDLNLLNRIKNIYVTYEFLDKLEYYNKFSEMHPMKIELSFTKPRHSFLSKILKDSKINNRTMFYWLNKFQNNQTEIFDSIKEEFGIEEQNIYVSKNRYIDITDRNDFIGSRKLGLFSTIRRIDDKFIFLGDYNTANDILAGYDAIALEEVRKRIANLLPLKTRTYLEILEGKKSYRETLYYRIAKFEGDPVTSEPIQNIYLPNDPDRNSLKYIDTQVKYDKKYTYVIYTYDVVFGNEYYSNGHETVDSNHKQNVANYPKLFLVENIFDQIESKVTDRPPKYPTVKIYSYKDVDNQVLFLLEKSSGTIKAKEISIKQEDNEKFAQIRQSQNLSNEDLIEFSGDDIIKKYELFRLESPPKTYQDFEKGKRIEIDTMLDPLRPEKRVSSVHIKDRIVPNKKYYYTFRCTDIHDQISNPSEIYEVTMINETGTIYMLFDIFKFQQQKDKEASKALKRFVMIKTDFLQETFEIDPGESKNKNELVQKIKTDIYSSQNKSIWNKKYKLRLVSKSTNKVYDINFKFDVETKIIE